MQKGNRIRFYCCEIDCARTMLERESDHHRFFYTAAQESREKCDRAKCQNSTRGDECTINETRRAADNEFLSALRNK